MDPEMLRILTAALNAIIAKKEARDFFRISCEGEFITSEVPLYSDQKRRRLDGTRMARFVSFWPDTPRCKPFRATIAPRSFWGSNSILGPHGAGEVLSIGGATTAFADFMFQAHVFG